MKTYEKTNGSVINSIISNRVASSTKSHIEFDFKGNTNEIAHLVKCRPGWNTA